ncbi:MAG: hypothetical protein EPN47_16065 [Acidobacteria bacterium]|nr:MAG: hypothetical protein EPN47_16065 [Acidobacteriota bacterium]
MKRRSFLKVTASLSSPIMSLSASGLDLGSTRVPETTGKPWELSNPDQRLVITQGGAGLSYQSFVRDAKGSWQQGSLAHNGLVSGPSFNLKGGLNAGTTSPRTLSLAGHATARAADGSRLVYPWSSEFSNEPGSPWFRLETTLHLPRDLRLQQKESLEPQIILWLSHTSTMMEGQSASWRRILLAQPTCNSLGSPGNDLPSVYLLDANRGIETMMYFDFSDMGWMSLRNIPRFLGYHCTTASVLEPNGNQRLGVGLILRRATGDILPAGNVRFSWYLLQRRFPKLITEQAAVARWMEALMPLFREKLDWPPCAASWKEFAEGMVQDVQKPGVALITVNGHRGLRAYVKQTSELWHESGNNFELMTVADVLWPSMLYLKIHPDPAYQQVIDDLLATLPHFYDADLETLSNDLVHGNKQVADSWYPFENGLIKYPMIGSLAGSKQLVENFISAYQTATRLAHRYNNLFPIYFRTDNLEQEGAGTNYAVGGLYAWGGLIAHRLTGNERYREAARRAVKVMTTVRAASLFHEPQELAFGALAALDLGLQESARYLLYEQLRMFYWYGDPSQKHDIRGMVQAAASILYPAFKENVEAMLPWTAIMKRGLVLDILLRLMDQQRRNNFYFFDACHTAAEKPALLPFVPYENLGTLELGGQTGNVGKEIYGSGEVLWSYLMFEALGSVRDRELLLVNLDLIDAFDAGKFPPRELEFILFNPTDQDREAAINIPVAGSTPAKLMTGQEQLRGAISISAGKFIRIKASY